MPIPAPAQEQHYHWYMFSYAFLRSTYHMIPSLFASERWGAAQVALRTHDTTAVFAKRMATSTWDAVRMHPPSCINSCIVRDCITCMGTFIPAAKDNFLTLKSNASHTRTHVCTHACTHVCTHAHTHTYTPLFKEDFALVFPSSLPVVLKNHKRLCGYHFFQTTNVGVVFLQM